jgi:hypothetical protein
MPVTDETRERLRRAAKEAAGADRTYERASFPELPPVPTEEGEVVAVIIPRRGPEEPPE